ncbi:MAG: ABC transporter ATP-binding protein [Oscillospiraceae bacterium]|nr:ABC transporter ATP-binding protein [Oscillospiraceae bacterium]
MTTREFQQKNTLSIFLSYFRPHRALFALDLICATVVSVIDLAFPLVTRRSMYDLLPQQQYRAFFTVMAVMIAAFTLRALLYYVIAYWGHTFGIRVEADIRRDLFVHMQELDVSFFDHNRTGQLMSRLTSDLFEITELAHHGPEDLLISSMTIIGALAIMFSIEWRLALVVACILPVFLAVIMSRRRRMSAASRNEKKKTAAINVGIESSLSGIRTARAFANEDEEIGKFDTANEAFKTSKRAFHHEMGLFNATMEFFMTLLSAAVITVGGYLIMRGEMNYIDLITFSLYITTFINPVRKLANFSEIFARGFAGVERFVALMRVEPALRDAPDAKELTDCRGEIDVDHVSFSYDTEEKADGVLHDVSVHIAPGEAVAIVGPSGGGKSTLCQLIPRFYEVSGGAIRIDGTDVRALTQASLHRAIGIVQQDVFLFADTVRENIRYGRPDATDAEIAEAAKRAEIYDDIMAMPQGFDTYVGERGTMLSGGQKQRISIARIFLKNPSILILDEATSALDSVTEVKIQHAFDELSRGRTALIIAHRLSTVRGADRILVVEEGRIAEEGSHEALLAKNGAYAALWRAQNGDA